MKCFQQKEEQSQLSTARYYFLNKESQSSRKEGVDLCRKRIEFYTDLWQKRGRIDQGLETH
jgi:hypothetical protein